MTLKERRKFKNHSITSNQHNYKILRNLIQWKVKIAKEQWLNNICQEVRVYIKQILRNLTFAQIQKFFQEESKRNKGINTLKSKNEQIFIETEQNVKRWKEYLEEYTTG